MSRYFFHVIDGHVSLDSEGIELSGMPAVRKEAIRAAGGILADADAAELAKSSWQMTVADEHGKAVYGLRFQATDYE